MIELCTGSRLHFGLMELCESAPNRYAGLGVMLAVPQMHARISFDSVTADISIADDIDAESAGEYQQRIQSWQAKSKTPSQVELLKGYPFHAGLGAGTQLACLLSVAEALAPIEIRGKANSHSSSTSQWKSAVQALTLGIDYSPNRSTFNAESLALLSGRGLRSAIGLTGFLEGGLVLDQGYENGDVSKRKIQAQVVRIPEAWRFVLIRGHASSAITGPLESTMIGRMAAKPNPSRARMLELARAAQDHATSSAFDPFCRELEEYMQLAGDMFAPVQGGRYNGAVCSQAVDIANQYGLKAVGQSSWGPTIFGLCNSQSQAESIAHSIRQHADNWTVQISSAAASGAMVRM